MSDWQKVIIDSHVMFQRRLGDNRDGKVHGANMEPTWVLSAPGGPHVGPMNLAIREAITWTLLTLFTDTYMHYSAWIDVLTWSDQSYSIW